MITPIEIRQQTFKKSLRGYDKEEVAAFLNTLSLEWEKLLEDLKKTKIELEKTSSNLDSLKQVESVLHKTLLQAEQTSKSTIENAKKNAELKIQEADGKAKDLLNQAMKERSRVELEISALTNQRDEILQQLKLFLESQSQRLNKFEEREMKHARQEALGSNGNNEVTESFFETSVENQSGSSMVNEMAEEL